MTSQQRKGWIIRAQHTQPTTPTASMTCQLGFLSIRKCFKCGVGFCEVGLVKNRGREKDLTMERAYKEKSSGEGQNKRKSEIEHL